MMLKTIVILAKTTMRESYLERCRLLIYQETPDISGFFYPVRKSH
jgi:uncharacterized protein (UPF0548 family)